MLNSGKYRKIQAIFLFALLLLNAFPNMARAAPVIGGYDYGIDEAGTQGYIDKAATSAVIDTSKHEITLPKSGGDAAVLFDNGFDYGVLTMDKFIHYSFNGTNIEENTIFSVNLSGLNPVAVSSGRNSPDVYIAFADGTVRYYSFNGSGMTENPALMISGLSNVVNIGYSEGYLYALTSDGNIKTYGFDGNAVVENPALELSSIINPVALATLDNGYRISILDNEKVTTYDYNGASLADNPYMAINGITGGMSISANETGIKVLAGKDVTHYSFSGNSMEVNSALSITGLENPTTVALKPGSPDTLIINGNKAEYWQFDGSGMVLNDYLSTVINGTLGGVGYLSEAGVVSLGIAGGARARVLAYTDTPQGTSIEFMLSKDGVNWLPSWKVDSGVLYVYTGGQYVNKGSPASVYPDVYNAVGTPDNPLPSDLIWAKPASPITQIYWKAVLRTTNSNMTPKIYVPQGKTVGIKVQIDNPPVVTPLPIGDANGWVYTATPEFKWTYSDADTGDLQTAYTIEISDKNHNPIYVKSVSGTNGSKNSYRLPTAEDITGHSVLWNSGGYEFFWRIQVYDSFLQESVWSPYMSFKVSALDRLRVVNVVSSTISENDPATWVYTWSGYPLLNNFGLAGQTGTAVPIPVKAGAKVTYYIDSIGPIDNLIVNSKYAAGPNASTIENPPVINNGYIDATVDNPQIKTANGTNKTWIFSVYTDPRTLVAPDNTIVTGNVEGISASIPGITASLPPLPPVLNTRLPYGTYINFYKVQGSIYDDWTVITNGQAE